MIGFPLQLPIEATTPRGLKMITEFFGDRDPAGEAVETIMVCISLKSVAEFTAIAKWILDQRQLAGQRAATP